MQTEALRFLTLEEVLELHAIAIERFGGSDGIRDAGLIESAVMLPQQTFGGELLCRSLNEMAAAYLHGIAKNHGFVDGNKRVAFMAADAFLQFNGFCFTFSEEEAERVAIAVATGECAREQLAEMIAANIEPLG